jgi:hypothetical protein
MEVRVGRVQAFIPEKWEAQRLPSAHYPREGFVASPHIDDWESGPATVRGAEAFWVDVGEVNIPSDYYYLAARGPVLADLPATKSCRQIKHQVLLDHRPDLTGETSSPGDYVASGTGVCRTHGSPVHWEYVVVAPGYGPIRHIGIPTSGLYVVIAAASGPQSKDLLQRMIDGTRFSNTSISTFIDAARRLA